MSGPTRSARLFWELAAELMAEDPHVVEGTIMNGRCLRLGTAFLALVDHQGSGLVVKLPGARVAALIATGAGRPFAPAGRVFREWVSVPTPDRRRWRALLREAAARAARAAHPRGAGVSPKAGGDDRSPRTRSTPRRGSRAQRA